MLFKFVIVNLFLITAANPFHKYPYVFLLDVGNEEIQNTNSEQIRVSMPGGSLALRYPAAGDQNTIAHVRVSGIDFGTDLKANIIDGGPGYKYVVLAFIGNPGVAYDAVITIQTMDNEKEDIDAGSKVYEEVEQGIDINGKSYEVTEEENHSAEELDPEITDTKSIGQASEYNYIGNEDVNSKINSEVSAIDSDDNDDDDDSDDQQDHKTDDDDNSKVNGYRVNDYKEKSVVHNLYYDKVRPYYGVRVLPEQVYMPPGPGEHSGTDDEGYNEDLGDEGIGYKDSNNNNNFDTDESSAVAS